MKTVLVTLLASLIATAAQSAVVLDQEQATINLGTTGEGFLVGGDQQYMLAQTVTAGIDGRLVRVEFPAVCESGRLEVEIRNLVSGDIPGSLVPGPTVLGSGGADAAAFPAGGGFVFRPIDLEDAIPMAAGDRFAIVLRNDTGRCGVGMGGSDDLYVGGASWWRYAGTPAGTWLGTGGFLDPIDTAFRTYVDSGPSRRAGFVPCSVAGFGPLPIPSFVPVCRCLRDASLRELRCGLMHPSMVLLRTLPDPLPAGKQFEVRWTLFATKPLAGNIEIDDVLPSGFGDAKQPLVFFGPQIPLGSGLTLSYTATAPAKGGTFRISTEVSIKEGQKAEEGTIRVPVEVVPR